MSAHFGVQLYSTDEDQRLSRVEYKGYADYYKQMPDVFAASRINLNISLKLIKSGIPLRVFDILACRGFLITNYQSEMSEYFEPGVDFIIYESMEDLYQKTDFYLRHETEREKIAAHGYETVSRRYTFRQQLEKILRAASE